MKFNNKQATAIIIMFVICVSSIVVVTIGRSVSVDVTMDDNTREAIQAINSTIAGMSEVASESQECVKNYHLEPYEDNFFVGDECAYIYCIGRAEEKEIDCFISTIGVDCDY